ncbi:MAG TPA: CorA family divalent cation transporter, partial [Candidatus Absconditabacterales bacterium]|nr:CorA family divalent cation transporter [Candidatus Absconditabacterales bacterium]
TYNSLMSIKTNSMISILTIFTAIIGIMTFITGLYGMNVSLPGQNYMYMFSLIIGGMIFIAVVTLFFFKRKGWL